MAVDLITLEVIRNYLNRVSEEMEVTVVRTAYNVAIYDSKDFACGILDAEGNLLSGSLGTPIFVNALPNAVKATYLSIGRDHLEPEDIVICNDPYNGGGTQGNDVVGIYPVFHRGEVVAFTAFKGHVLDMGGMRPSGYYNNTSEIFQELFRVPPVKLYRRGRQNDDVVNLIQANTRLPKEVMGDIRAMVGALRTGGRRILEVIDRYSYDRFSEHITEILSRSERIARERVSQLPEGVYSAEFRLDGDGDDEEPISRGLRVVMRVEVKGGEMTVDLSDSSPQSKGPMNSPKANTISYVRLGFKMLIDPLSIINDGTFRPLKVITKSGTIFDPVPPAPLALWIETTQGLVDLLFKAFANAIPNRVRGSTSGSDVINFIYGTDQRNGRYFVVVDTLQGGWGGMPSSDGSTLYAVSEGNSTYPMAEMIEANYPLVVSKWELIPDSAGPGKFRGGLGVERDYKIVSPCYITLCYDRHFLSPPWGVLGGKEASTNYVVFQLSDGRTEEHTKVTHYPLTPGSVISFRTGGGGGYGDPLARDLSLVQRDVRLGYVSPDKGRTEYGVVLDSDFNLNIDATTKLRSEMCAARR